MKRFSILLVDDNKHFLDAFEFLLLDVLGERVLSLSKVNNGEECLKFLDTRTPDVIFMDMDMPVMNGMQATKLIIDRYRFVNIIAVSFHNEMESIRDMVEAGCRNYILKEDISRDTILRIFNSL